MKLYEIGEKVWIADCGTRQVTKPCPVCCGKLAVDLTLGDGTVVRIVCDYCDKGSLTGPRGVVGDYEYVAEPSEMTITKRQVASCAGAADVAEYHFAGGRYAHDEDVFATRKEAATRAEAKRAEHQREKGQSDFAAKEYEHKSYAWHAGYHLREAKQHRERLAYHERMVVVCRAKADKADKE